MTIHAVYLEKPSNEFLVSQEGYEEIRKLVVKYQLCGICREQIDTDAHLLVGKNICLACLLHQQPDLTFGGVVRTDKESNSVYSFFKENQVYTITANVGKQAEKDLFLTIESMGFNLPETYVPFKGDKDNPLILDHRYWNSFYGTLSSSVIVAEYQESSGQKTHAVFLCYRGGQAAVELNKRNSTHKQLFKRAQEVIERTKHGTYYYDTDGYEISKIVDSTLFPVIAQMESAVYDVQRNFTTGGHQT